MKFSAILALIAATPASSTFRDVEPSLPPPRMDNSSNPVSQAVPTVTTRGEGQTSVPFRPLPIPPPHVAAGSHPLQSFTPDQLNALRAQVHALKLAKGGKPTAGRTQQPIRVPNQAVHDLWTRPHGPDVNAYVVDSDMEIHNSLEPDFPVGDRVVEQPPVGIAAPPQPAKEKGVRAEVVDPEMTFQGPNTDRPRGEGDSA